MGRIFRKTAKGHDEIATRSRKLGPRLRAALILVDGRRGEAELQGLIAVQAAEALQALVDLGLIEALADRPEAEAAPAPRRPPAAALPFEALRRDAVQAFADSMGPVGTALAVRMEKAHSPDALRPLLEVATHLLRQARGAQAASDYAARFGVTLR